jgi:hypothetical protein
MRSSRGIQRPNGGARFSAGSAAGVHSECAGWLPTILLLSLFLASCVHWPEVNEDCESYGVAESRTPMGYKVHAMPLGRADLDRICGAVRSQVAGVHPEALVNGCAIPQRDGSVLAYYRDGDRCAMNHELCHALHGTNHTERYLEELAAGIPMPYCPAMQLAGLNRR